jgi:FkbM family methyltransferase
MSIAWLKNRFTDLKYFSWILKNWHYWKGGKHSLTPFIKYWISYLVPRLVFGREKAPDVSRNIISRFKGKNLIIPLPINSTDTYWIGLRDSVDFDAFREVCINDHYNYSQIRPGMIVADVGAHIGTFTLLASKKVGEWGKVIAVEAEKNNFNQLNKNLELNGIKNVMPIKIALSDFNGEKDFFITKGSGCHSFSPPVGQEIVDKIKIKVKSLDTLMKELNIEKIDLLKIDAEGAELEILKGAQETLIKNPKMKMVIAAYHSPKEASEVISYLKELNFSPKILPGIFTLVVVE